jgi:TonB-dependent siderophore receptor
MPKSPSPFALAPLALATLLALGTPLAAQAQSAAVAVEVSLPAQPLSQSLLELARQTGTTLVAPPALLAGRTAPALAGRLTAAQALDRLLQGSGLAGRVEGAVLTVRKVPADAAAADYTLREVRVSGRRDGETEGTGSYTTGAITIGKTAQALRELPQSVSVLTRQRLDDQNFTTLGQAAEQATGITVRDGDDRLVEIHARGFLVESIQLDGGAPMSTSSSHYGYASYDLAEYDRMELLRGVAGLLNGTGNPGGAVNLVRKMPTAKPQFNFALSAGRWDSYRSELDASGPLAFDGKLRGRAVVALDKRHHFVDHNSSWSPLFYGVLEADIGPDAVLTLGAREQRVNAHGTSTSLPRYSNGADVGLPRNTGLTTDWSFRNIDSKEVFAKLAWRVADRWTWRVNATRTEQEGYQKGGFANGAVDMTTLRSVWRGTSVATSSRQTLLDTNLSGAFDLFGRTHEVLVGADTQDITSRWRGTAVHPGSGSPLDVFDPERTPWSEPTTGPWTRDYSPVEQRQYGAYGTLRLEVADHTKLIVGARVNRFRYNQVYRTQGAGGDWNVNSITQYAESAKLTPFGGIVHDLGDAWTAYASFAEVYRPQANMKAGPAPGTGLEPMRGSNAELGLKGELLDGKLNTAFAIYRIVQDKRAVRDPNFPAESSAFAGSCCYLTQGKVVSQGFDAEVNGEVARGVQVALGYTYNHNRNKTENAAFSTITPKHLVKLWGTWQLPGAASAWKLGAGATLQSAQYVQGTASSFNAATGQYNGPSTPYSYTQSGYAVWSAMAEYRIDRNLTLTLNLSNLFDRTYYRTMGGSYGGNFYGEPRNAVLTLRGRF